MLVRGHHRDDESWSVGIVDPGRRDMIVGAVHLDAPRRAVATSGTAERGEHIWRRMDQAFVQATVIADDIVTADVLATAIIAGDADDLRRLTNDADVEVLAFGADGTVWATPGARETVRSDAGLAEQRVRSHEEGTTGRGPSQ